MCRIITGNARPVDRGLGSWLLRMVLRTQFRAAIAGILGVTALGTTATPVLTSREVLASATGFGSAVTVYHGNGLGTGVENPTTALRRLRKAWTSPKLDGALYGEPLVYAGRVYAATENDTVYAFAADTGRIIWSRQVGAPVPASNIPCGNISPHLGITGTPVIDPARQEIFVVADEVAGASGGSHHLVGLDLYSGRIELNKAVNPPKSIPTALLQRPGLALDNGKVVIAFGGNYGDCGTYHGAIAAVPEAGGVAKYYVFDRAKGEREGAVWMGGGAPLVDSKGNIWVAVGNGSKSSLPYDQSDSVTELSASLRREQFFAPSTWAEDNRTDADLGSATPAFVGGYVFQVGKGHVAYLLDPGRLGGVGGQVAKMPLCTEDPGGGLAVQGGTVYVACGEGVTAVRISAQAPHMSVLWTTSKTPSGASINGPPIVAGGLVWSLDAYGTLWGLNRASGVHVTQERTGGGEANHFPTPTVADGLLLAPTTDQLFAYDGTAGRPPPPLPVPSGA
jgi:outer membrane protein assembly factor BamB